MKNASVVDYNIASLSHVENINAFEIYDINPILSDIHCSLHLELLFTNMVASPNLLPDNNELKKN